MAWRLLEKGWLQTHPGSPWEDCWHFVNIKEFAYNIVVLVHRFADFGRIGVLIFLAVVFLIKRQLFKERQTREVLLLAVSSVFFVVVVSLISTNPFGHRYFIASYISFILLAFLLLIKLNINKLTLLRLMRIINIKILVKIIIL